MARFSRTGNSKQNKGMNRLKKAGYKITRDSSKMVSAHSVIAPSGEIVAADLDYHSAIEAGRVHQNSQEVK